jgi:hypothetical protein
MYKLLTTITNENFVIRLSDNAQIPMIEANTDYQAYLKWLDAGGVVLAADAAAEEGNTEGTQ